MDFVYVASEDESPIKVVFRVVETFETAAAILSRESRTNCFT